MNFFAISWSNSQPSGLENSSNLVKYPFLEIKNHSWGKIIHGQNLYRGEKGSVQMPAPPLCSNNDTCNLFFDSSIMLSLEQARVGHSFSRPATRVPERACSQAVSCFVILLTQFLGMFRQRYKISDLLLFLAMQVSHICGIAIT